MHSLKNNKFIPIEHREVYRQLLSDLMMKVLFTPLRIIRRSEAQIISDAILIELRHHFSSKQLEKLIKEAAENKEFIVKPRPGTLNLLAQFVLGEYKPGDTSSYSDKRHFWIIYLEKILYRNIRQENTSTLEKVEAYNLKNEDYNKAESLIHITGWLPQKIRREESEKVYDMEVINIFDSLEIKKMHKRACLFGGFAIGIMNALFLIFAPGSISGYWDLSSDLKINLVPLITSADILCGLSTGLFIYGIYGIPTFINIRPSIITKKEKILLTIIASSIMIFFRQLASRDLIRYGSFNLEIDLETVSYCVVGSIGVIDISKLLKSNYIIPRIVIIEETLITTIKISLVMIGIYFLYHFFIELKAWHNLELPSNAFIYIKLDIPQPGRMILVSFIMFSNMITMLGLRNLYFKNKIRYYTYFFANKRKRGS